MYMVFDSVEKLKEGLYASLVKIPGLEGICIEDVTIEIPREKTKGDYASNCAMKLSRIAGMKPMELAEVAIKGAKFDCSLVEDVSVAFPGFINFILSKKRLFAEGEKILSMGSRYGGGFEKHPKKINVEFVSANPTGPVHLGNARGGAVGDVLANCLRFAGNEVEKEFYLNDAGNQIEKFKESLWERYKQATGREYEISEDMYQGEDILDLATLYINRHPNGEYEDEEALKDALLKESLQENVSVMMASLEKYGIDYNTVFSEQTLHSSHKVADVVSHMEKMGATYKKDGAVWFRGTQYGLEKDEVLIRSNNIPTYYAADIAYHYNKLVTRGFDVAINVWGADHHGHVARLKKALAACGIEENRLVVVLMQLVNLVRGKEVVRLSKRRGEIVTLGSLIDEVGVSPARFVFNSTSPNTHMDFDLELATKQSSENPVFYVQYAHARVCSILSHVSSEKKVMSFEALKEKEEIALLETLSRFPKEIDMANRECDPSRITKYALCLAGDFHTFYNAHRVLVEDENLKGARLALVSCVKTVIKNALDLLGVEAPESM